MVEQSNRWDCDAAPVTVGRSAWPDWPWAAGMLLGVSVGVALAVWRWKAERERCRRQTYLAVTHRLIEDKKRRERERQRERVGKYINMARLNPAAADAWWKAHP